MVESAAREVGIDEFVQGLAAIPGFTPKGVNAYLQAHRVQPQTLRPYLFFSPASYTRNLVFKNDLFEVIAICWDIGQVSRIHNHRDQRCWMVVPIGRLKNQNYRVLDRDPQARTCRLVPSKAFLIAPTAPLEVDTEEPVHQVLNLAEYAERAVSLHLYSRPFSSCEVYSLDKGTYWDVPLSYTSEFGQLCPGEQGSPPD